MTHHLSPDRLIPNAEPPLLTAEQAHLQACPRCRIDQRVLASVLTHDPTSLDGLGSARIAADETRRALGRALRAALYSTQCFLTTLHTDQSEPAPEVLGLDRTRFSVERWIGTGLTGPVYEVLERASSKRFALKVLTADDLQMQERLARVLPQLRQLRHPNVATLYEIHQVEPHWLLLSPWVAGPPFPDWLEQWLTRPATLSWARTQLCLVFAKLTTGLLAVHQAGLVHGHLSPPKAAVQPDGNVALLETSIWVSAPELRKIDPWREFIAPECRYPHTPTQAGDWFALGAMLHTALRQVDPIPDLTRLATEMMDPDPTRRPSGLQILSVLHDSLSGGGKTSDYTRLGPLAEGGMGMVHRVFDPTLRRTVALKTIHSRLAQRRSVASRFVAEAQVTAQLQHPGVVPVYEMRWLEDGRPAFTMREVRGRTMGHVIRDLHAASGPGAWGTTMATNTDRGWTLRRLVEAFLRICETMAYAHDRGVLHRDLKPANIMLGDYGEVLVLDWGLARVAGDIPHNIDLEPAGQTQIQTIRSADPSLATQAGWISGTPAYMSPEQALGAVGEVDQRSDIYSLGAILYELLRGEPPFKGLGPQTVLTQVRAGPIPHLEPRDHGPPLPEELVSACHRAMAHDPIQRFASASALADELSAWLEGARKREKALQVIRQAEEVRVRAETLRRRAGQLRQDAEGLLSTHGIRSEEAWARREEAIVLERQAQRADLEREQRLLGALLHAPDLPQAHQSLLDHHHRAHMMARAEQDQRSMLRAEQMLHAHLVVLPTTDPSRRRVEAYLAGDGPDTNIDPNDTLLFVGRSAELSAISAHFSGGARLVTLMGTVGVGKTRIAIHFGHCQLDAHPGGVFICNLVETRDQEALIREIAHVLGVRLTERDSLAQLGYVLRNRGSMLLLLDNVEHLIDTINQVLEHLHQAAPELRLLVTSRSRLGALHEAVVVVGPLSLLTGMELFASQARRARAGFSLNASNREVVGTIVERLDRLPLPIELAASQVAQLSPRELLARLDQRFELLHRREPGEGALRGTLDWSWELLSSWERATLAQCSVFHGGFDLAAAEGVVDLQAWPEAPPVLLLLGALCDDHLIRLHHGDTARVRYSLYESIRAYAAEKLAEEGAIHTPGGQTFTGPELCAAIAQRHRQHYARFGSDNQIDALTGRAGGGLRRALAIDIDNLVTAIESALASDDGSMALAALRAAWHGVFRVRGPFAKGAELARRIRETLELSPAEREQLLCLEAEAWSLVGRPEAAQWAISEGLVIARQHEHQGQEGILLGLQAILYRQQGRLEQAEATNHLALERHRAHNQRLHEGRVLGNLALIALNQRRSGGTREKLERALTIFRELGSRSDEAITVSNLALLHHQQGRLDQALRCCRSALSIAQELQNRRAEGEFFSSLANIHSDQGDLEQAQKCLETALEIHREVGNRSGEAVVLGNLGNLHAAGNRLDEARSHTEIALEIHRDLGDTISTALSLGNLGDILLRAGAMDEAEAHLRAAIERFQQARDPFCEGAFLGSLALLLARRGALDEAWTTLERAEHCFRDLPPGVEPGKLLCKRALIEAQAGDPRAAQASLGQAVRLAERLGVGTDSELALLIQSTTDQLGMSS